MFKNMMLYRLTRFDMSAADLASLLSENAIQPLQGLEIQKSGWVPPKGAGESFVHESESQILISLCVEKKLLPPAVINAATKARVRDIEEKQGKKVGRKQLREIKEKVVDELIPRAFAVRSYMSIWIDPVGKWLVMDASSPSKADDAVAVIFKTTDKIGLELVNTKVSPSSAMTEWLSDGELPSVFTLDDSCEMRAPGDNSAKIKYSGLSPDAEEAKKHVESGKTTIQQAMTWDSKISFILTENMQIKKLHALSILKEDIDNDMDAFDAAFVIMSKSIPPMLSDIVEAMGGFMEETAA